MYTISEAAKKLGVTRQSVYNRLDKVELSAHVSQTGRGKMLSEEGFKILKGLYNFMPDCQEPVSRQDTDTYQTGSEERFDATQPVSEQSDYSQHTVNVHHSDRQADIYIESLIEQINFLKSVVIEKDKQIAVKDEQILNLTRLTENGQILLKQEQDKNKFLIETEEAKRKKSLWSIFIKK